MATTGSNKSQSIVLSKGVPSRATSPMARIGKGSLQLSKPSAKPVKSAKRGPKLDASVKATAPPSVSPKVPEKDAGTLRVPAKKCAQPMLSTESTYGKSEAKGKDEICEILADTKAIIKETPRPSIAAGYELVGGGEREFMVIHPPVHAEEKEAETSDDSERRRKERRRERERRAERKWLAGSIRIGTAKLVICSCTAATLLVVVVSALFVGAYYIHQATQKEEEPTVQFEEGGAAVFISDVYHFRDAACLRGSQAPRPECVHSDLQMAESGQTCGRGLCVIVTYLLSPANDTHFGSYFHPEPYITRIRRMENRPVFCVGKDDDVTKLRVCMNGRCNFEYDGIRFKYDADEYEGKWEDNCDEKNPCWISRSRDIHYAPPFERPGLWSREQCRGDADAHCPKDNVTAAIVWMQHLYCDFNPSGTGKHCRDLPLRLWVCAKCNETQDWLARARSYHQRACKPSEAVHVHEGNCTIGCASSGYERHVRMPDGSACVPKRSEENVKKNATAYCFAGACFFAEDVQKAKFRQIVKKKTECLEEKRKRKEYWQKYVCK